MSFVWPSLINSYKFVIPLQRYRNKNKRATGWTICLQRSNVWPHRSLGICVYIPTYGTHLSSQGQYSLIRTLHKVMDFKMKLKRLYKRLFEVDYVSRVLDQIQFALILWTKWLDCWTGVHMVNTRFQFKSCQHWFNSSSSRNKPYIHNINDKRNINHRRWTGKS